MKILNKFLSGKKDKIAEDIGNSPEKTKKILLFSLDMIGDYIVRRNFIEAIRNHKNFKDYSITLVGNSSYKELATEFDKDFINKFVWVDINKINNQKIKDLSTFLQKNVYEIAINLTFSRSDFQDKIMEKINAKRKIGFDCDLWNLTLAQKIRNNIFYTELVTCKDEVASYFTRTKDLYKYLTKDDFPFATPCIKLKENEFNNINFNFDENYVILFPFASVQDRTWNFNNFIDIANFLISKYSLKVYICGSPKDYEKVKKYNIKSQNIYNICGKFKLSELPYIFSKAKCIITNDTSGFHIATASNKNVICITSGVGIAVENFIDYFIENNIGILKYPYNEENTYTLCPKEFVQSLINKDSKAITKNRFTPIKSINCITTNDVKYILQEKIFIKVT